MYLDGFQGRQLRFQGRANPAVELDDQFLAFFSHIFVPVVQDDRHLLQQQLQRQHFGSKLPATDQNKENMIGDESSK